MALRVTIPVTVWEVQEVKSGIGKNGKPYSMVPVVFVDEDLNKFDVIWPTGQPITAKGEKFAATLELETDNRFSARVNVVRLAPPAPAVAAVPKAS